MNKISKVFLSCLLLVGVASCATEQTISSSTDDNSQTGSSDINTDLQPEREISVDYENMTIYVPSERNLRIAQFADVHFGVEGQNYHNDKINRTIEFMDYVVEKTDPDFIVCSGDNILNTGSRKLQEFIDMMEEYQTPWTFIYGNHDSESDAIGYKKSDLSAVLLEYETQYLLYKEDYTETGATYYDMRYGNFVVSVRDLDNNDLLGAYIFIDAGTYDYREQSDSVPYGKQYQFITQGQIDWYKSTIDNLQKDYSKPNEIIPSIIFSHIQLQEHAEAYLKAKNGAGAEFVIEQENLTEEDILSGGPKYNSGFYDVLVETGSTKGYFVGHAHSYYFQVKMDGIILGFAPQTGFSKLFETNDNPRLTYVYNVNTSFDLTTTKIEEQENLGEGLVAKYFDGTNGDSIHFGTFDEETGLYTLKVKMNKQWARVKLYFNNEVISTADNNYIITGDYAATCDTNSMNLYPGTDVTKLYYPNASIAEYTFTFDSSIKTLNIDAPAPEVIDVDGLYCVYTDSSNAITDATISTPDDNGNYIFRQELSPWRYVKLYFDGEIITDTNTTISGLYYNSTSTDWGINLYWSPSVSNALANGQYKGTYIFIYNPTNKTLAIGYAGLLYNDNEIADYNSDTGDYTFTYKAATDSTLTMVFDGFDLSSTDLTINGDYSTEKSNVTDNVFYQKEGDNKTFYCAKEGTYIISYNPSNNTLNFVYQVVNGFFYTTRYNGTESATPVEYEATVNSDGTYTINFEFTKAWGYINFTYNGVALTTDNTTFVYSGLTGIYMDGNSIMCNGNTEAFRAYVITYDPATSTITMVAAE